MYNIEHYWVTDIHMGSPYMCGHIRVTGGFFPIDLQEIGGFQDKHTLSSDGRTCFLIYFDREDDNLGFRIVKVSDEHRSIQISERVLGGCDEIKWIDETTGVELAVWEYQKGTRTEVINQFGANTDILFYNKYKAKFSFFIKEHKLRSSKYEIKHYQLSEIREGSPFLCGYVKINGGYSPQSLIDLDAFQDKCAISLDGKTCYLIHFDMENDDLGFRIVKISDEDKSIQVSDRIMGGCEEIKALATGVGVEVNVWEHRKGNRIEIVDQFNSNVDVLNK